MKNIAITIVFCIIAITAKSQNSNSKSIENTKIYCAKMKDGITSVVYQGNPITSDVLLENGITLKTDGTIVTNDGTRTVLKDGQCIGQDGTTPARKREE